MLELGAFDSGVPGPYSLGLRIIYYFKPQQEVQEICSQKISDLLTRQRDFLE